MKGSPISRGRRLILPPDRSAARAPFPYANGTYLLGKGPFSVEDDDCAFFERLKVDFLVVKNAGGRSSRAKLDAARVLSIPVIMIERPTPPVADTVATVEQALEWCEGAFVTERILETHACISQGGEVAGA